MSYSIEVRPEEHLIICVMNQDFSVQHELSGYAEDLKGKLDAMSEPVIQITDVDAVPGSFGDLVSGLGLLTQGKLAVLNHPNIKLIIVVTTKDLFAFGAKALKQSQYGGLQVTVAKTLDEAIKLARQEQVAN